MIAREALMQLENNLVMGNNVHREYVREFVKVGSTVNIRRPVKFESTDGAVLDKQDVEEANTTIVVDQRKHVGWGFTTQDLTLTIEEFSERYIKPATIALAQKIDRDLTSLYYFVPNWVPVTPSGTIATFAEFAAGAQRLDEGAVPQDNRKAVLSPADHWALAGNQTGLFFNTVGVPAYRRGSIGEVGGIDTFMDQNVRSHTTGTFTTGSTPLVAGAAQNVTYAAANKTTWSQTIDTDGWANATLVLRQGDVIMFAGVNAVNPVPGQSGTGKDALSYLKEFTVLADVTSDGSGLATVTISPPIITSGPQQTCSAAPANDAAITEKGAEATAYVQNLMFHRNAFALVTVPLEMPDGVSFKARETHKGISMRVVKDYDIINDEDIIRLDVLYGVKTLYPELATRINGA
jgi:hypothetical protein